MRSERGSGTILAVAIVGGVVAVTGLALPLYMGYAVRQAVAGAADAAALAAADTASGLLPGYPCDAAAVVAAANGSGLASCEVDGLVATVTATRYLLGFAVSARATAGPPPSGVD